METASQKFDRLLKAFDALVAEEAALIKAADYPGVSGIQARAQPVLDALSALAPGSVSPGARAKVGAVIERREQNLESLHTQLAVAQEQLDSLQSSARRAAQVAPAYGKPQRSVGPKQLRTSG